MFSIMSWGVWVFRVQVVNSGRWEWKDKLGAGKAFPNDAAPVALPLIPANLPESCMESREAVCIPSVLCFPDSGDICFMHKVFWGSQVGAVSA